ncbi:MAG TPA: adenylate/guanylate cyclase domain-containing protein [Burkholderiales bacterium]|nr:adenylate/guanylate cyclase domain-containing protein [Burkholderiales bacterium]
MESAGRTLVCSVLFLDIADYSQRPVAEQLQLKQAFNQALAAALEQVAPRDRIILDTGDGAAVTFMGDPEDALFAAMAMRDLAAAVPVRLGVNLGPVRLVKDLNGQMNIIGDGINVAQRVMSFSRPGQLLVSRSFYEVVSCLSRDYATLFRHEGSRTDKHVRAHEVYAVVGATPAPKRLDQVEAIAQSRPPGAAGWLTGSGLFGLRRSALLAAPLAFLLIVAGGVTARAMMPDEPAPKAAPAKPVSKPVAAAPAVVAPPVAAPAGGGAAPPTGGAAAPEEPRAKKFVARVEPKAEKPAAAPKGPGRLEVAVAPWGDVLVDGRNRGRAPPLLVLEVPAGSHKVEIRNATSPAHVAQVEVKPGETVRIQHRFR